VGVVRAGEGVVLLGVGELPLYVAAPVRGGSVEEREMALTTEVA